MRFGKTGIETSLLGMGTGMKAWNKSSAQNRLGRRTFVRTLVHAWDRGIRYFDMADMYGAHDYMKEAMAQAKMPREKLMLLTKSNAKDAKAMRADLDRMRKELDTDYFDVVLMHCMTKADWNETLAPCMEVLEEAKEKGIVRAKGVSCHDYGAMKTAASSPWVDIMLSRINPFGIKMDGEPERIVKVLEEAHKNGKGMLGMKILGEGQAADRMDESLRFVLPLPCIDAITIGFLYPEEIDDVISRMEAIA